MRHNALFVLCSLLLLACKEVGTLPPPPAGGVVSSINCNTASVVGGATSGAAYVGTITISYNGGNGGSYTGGTPALSSGVTGLTATLQGGTLAHGGGNFTYAVSGTPSAAGIASFDIVFGLQTCRVELTVADPPLVQYGTPFANVTDRQDATLYQVNTRAFSTSSNFQGVIARLDSIKALGANVIYLMPVHPVGTVKSVNSPYSVRDYTGVNPEFGTLADLRALVNGAHARNMSVILDWVANHTAWDHPWITAHSDWYLKNAVGEIVSPPSMGWNDVAQLNFNSAPMRLEMIRSMKYWVYTANVDGFRFDYADGPPVDFWKQAIDTLRNITTHKLLLLAEGNRSNHFTAGFDFIFGFSFFGQLKNIYSNNVPATAIDALNTSEYMNAAPGQQVVRYLTNHDVNGSDGTPLDLFGGGAGSMAAFVVVAYMKGVPMIYNGQEVGMPTRLAFPFTATDVNWSLNPAVTAEYKRVIAFRNASAAIRRGALTSYTDGDVCAFTKTLGAERVFVLSNLRNRGVSYALPAAVANSTWTNAMTGAPVTLTTALQLPAYTYLVLKN